jgi:hypothetical protein
MGGGPTTVSSYQGTILTLPTFKFPLPTEREAEELHAEIEEQVAAEAREASNR